MNHIYLIPKTVNLATYDDCRTLEIETFSFRQLDNRHDLKFFFIASTPANKSFELELFVIQAAKRIKFDSDFKGQIPISFKEWLKVNESIVLKQMKIKELIEYFELWFCPKSSINLEVKMIKWVNNITITNYEINYHEISEAVVISEEKFLNNSVYAQGEFLFVKGNKVFYVYYITA